MLTVSLTRGPEACAAVHTTHCYNEQSVGAGAVFVQVGEFRGAVVVAKLKHLGGIGNGAPLGRAMPPCMFYLYTEVDLGFVVQFWGRQVFITHIKLQLTEIGLPSQILG